MYIYVYLEFNLYFKYISFCIFRITFSTISTFRSKFCQLCKNKIVNVCHTVEH